MRIFGVILAGGAGSRMGADKALVQLAGQSLLSHAIARLEPQVERLAISANGDPARLAGYGLPILPDAVALGPLSGVLAGLRWAAPLGATAVVTLAVDTPFAPGDLVPQLCLAAETSPEALAIATAAKNHPTCAIWPVALAGALADFLSSGAKARVLGFADQHHAARAQFPDEAAFQNLNTPADIIAAEALIRAES
ncbi:molybdenum cofactor guanylyltransferase [Cypionkella aquatica]|uniref:Molybdenum cofactor guanylyltransferase n=1 Tax=Cypionkella aquatica TaxID=1756042 RepID=A0AA37U5T0_9RHOB|nr:molybdenum cofactor guanylyltransferase MobA [Cypionkella aquatica]GLS87520.1 molybdenum cofactor guanylyltransferase [Cypionkella aquatica]